MCLKIWRALSEKMPHKSRFKIRSQEGNSGQKWPSAPDFQDQAGHKQGVRPDSEAEVTNNRLIDSLYQVSGLNIFYMSGSGLDAGDPEGRKPCTPGTSSLWRIRVWALESDRCELKLMLHSL